jgi:hypothetical protein
MSASALAAAAAVSSSPAGAAAAALPLLLPGLWCLMTGVSGVGRESWSDPACWLLVLTWCPFWPLLLLLPLRELKQLDHICMKLPPQPAHERAPGSKAQKALD